MRLTSGYEKRRARIEMVPLLDVVFLLLVFFIYVMLSMTVHRDVPVFLPKVAGPKSVESYPVVITITDDNRLLVDNHESDMASAVASVLSRTGQEQRKVLIQGDRQADLGIALELLSRLREAGVDAVSFLVEQPSENALTGPDR